MLQPSSILPVKS